MSKSLDKWIWHLKNNGTYTVKSGYRFVVKTLTNITNLTARKAWDDLGVTVDNVSFVSFIEDCLEGRHGFKSRRLPNQEHQGLDAGIVWMPPEPGWCKCNTDVATFQTEEALSFAVIFGVDTGHFVTTISGHRSGLLEPHITETLS
ncbi:hypothetical protein Godav_029226 [Gossypium davidsonii]|uniref:Uncharacterized protein n=1 Tax=Gossypium davidsonii TaxID=34287 RepID=A0A7J8T9T4_GOSDV|nr:hypothetical protein [Gossypium davidsonii]